MSTTQADRSVYRYCVFLRPVLVAVAVVASSVAVHAAASDATSAPEKAVNKAERAVSDSWITAKVKSEILANSVSKAFNVRVSTKNGVVSLKGTLPNQDAIDLVKMIAEKVKGVQSVDASGLVIAN